MNHNRLVGLFASFAVACVVLLNPSTVSAIDKSSPQIAHCVVAVCDATGKIIAHATPDATGACKFSGMAPGAYSIIVIGGDAPADPLHSEVHTAREAGTGMATGRQELPVANGGTGLSGGTVATHALDVSVTVGKAAAKAFVLPHVLEKSGRVADGAALQLQSYPHKDLMTVQYANSHDMMMVSIRNMK